MAILTSFKIAGDPDSEEIRPKAAEMGLAQPTEWVQFDVLQHEIVA